MCICVCAVCLHFLRSRYLVCLFFFCLLGHSHLWRLQNSLVSFLCFSTSHTFNLSDCSLIIRFNVNIFGKNITFRAWRILFKPSYQGAHGVRLSFTPVWFWFRLIYRQHSEERLLVKPCEVVCFIWSHETLPEFSMTSSNPLLEVLKLSTINR